MFYLFVIFEYLVCFSMGVDNLLAVSSILPDYSQ